MNFRIPEDSYINYFMELMEDQETPKDYDFWAAVWSIGAVVGRHCIIDRPRAPIYFNWYVIICAESGMTRKSTAISAATNIVQQAKPEETILIQTKTTPEKLWELLSAHSKTRGYCDVAISVSELVTFLGREGYSMGMPGLLTDLYDCPAYRDGGGTLIHGTQPIKNPFICFLAGSTPSWLVRAINPDVVEGGFTSRCVFISSERRKKLVLWPSNERRNTEAAVEYLATIRKYAERSGAIGIDEDARVFLEGWYKSRRYSMEPYARSFESREDGHILRLAGTLALSELRETISQRDCELAIVAISKAKAAGNNIFSQRAFDLKLANGVDRIREYLLRAGKNGLKNQELYFKVRYNMDAAEYNTILGILTEIGAVREFVVGTPTGRGRAAKYYFATSKLVNPKVWAEIQERTGVVQPELPVERMLEQPAKEIVETKALDTSAEMLSHIDLPDLTTYLDKSHTDPYQSDLSQEQASEHPDND